MKTLWKIGAACLLASTATLPVQAQSTSESAESAPAEDRLAVATRIAAKILPEGKYADMTTEMLVGTDANGDRLLLSVFDFPLPPDAEKKLSTGKTMLELMEETDPYFRERMAITLKIFGEELRPVFLEMEPAMRAGIAGQMAQNMTYEELVALEAFFNTPAGDKFAGQMLTMWMSPEVMQASAEMIPAMMEIMPNIMARVEKETSHLPKPKNISEDEEYEDY